ncbi:MAG: choice-of-anchor E domain-containing protein [Phycisphaeraceae bacterium]|nr:choice-of-anchor E domain-containing protein [Phycisphaeraceae bacterium]MCB9848294.1 choice-of-anchor E domain-containing protein [Phycisphaeraceae bacterium]
MIRTLALTGVLAGALFFAPAAFAGAVLEESYSGMVSLQSTDWEESLDVQQFDEMGGARKLVSICIHLEGAVTGSAGLESLDNSPAKVHVELSAHISLSLNGSSLGVVIPIANDSFNASAFDGIIDFGGSSGMTFSALSASDSADNKLTANDDAFASFIGDGSVKLDGAAMGTSFGSGAGNLVLQFNTQAELAYRITYKYTEVPAPGASILLAGMGLAASRRRR